MPSADDGTVPSVERPQSPYEKLKPNTAGRMMGWAMVAWVLWLAYSVEANQGVAGFRSAGEPLMGIAVLGIVFATKDAIMAAMGQTLKSQIARVRRNTKSFAVPMKMQALPATPFAARHADPSPDPTRNQL